MICLEISACSLANLFSAVGTRLITQLNARLQLGFFLLYMIIHNHRREYRFWYCGSCQHAFMQGTLIPRFYVVIFIFLLSVVTDDIALL